MVRITILIITVLVFSLVFCPVHGEKLNFSEEKDISLLKLDGTKKSRFMPAGETHKKEIHFNISVDEVALFKQQEGDYLKVSDLAPYTKPGEPQLPMKTYVVNFSRNTEISDVYVTYGKYRKINNKLNIIPSQRAYTFSAKKDIVASPININKIQNYNLNSYFPGKIISYDTGYDNENNYVLVRFFPVQYISGQSEAVLITDVNIIVVYSEKVQVKKSMPEITARCVIITPGELKTQAEELAKFHNSTNVSTAVITTQEIRDNYNASQEPGYEGYKNSSIPGWNNITNYNYTLARKIISFLNNQSGSSLEYVVLFGNGKYIPPGYYIYDEVLTDCNLFKCKSIDYYNSWVPTDFFYVSPDYDLIPNYKLGRIPVNNKTDAENFVNKTKNWYNNSFKSQFKNAAVIGGRLFLNMEYGSYDEIFSGELSAVELINNYLSGSNITKIFLSNNNYDKENIKSVYTGNYGFIYHGSHGSGDGTWKNQITWTELVNVTEITGIKGNFTLPVVVSPACMNGAYDTNLRPNDYYGYVQQESYAGALLNSDAGAIAYFGGARTNYGRLDVYLKRGYVQTVKKGYMDGMLDGIFKSYNKGGTALGELSLNAVTEFVINNEFSDEITARTLFGYTFLGDPALEIPKKEKIPEKNRPGIEAINHLYYNHINIGPGWNPSVGDLPIYALKDNATVTCTADSEKLKIKLIDASKIFNNTNTTEFNLNNSNNSNKNNYVNYTFNLTDAHTYLVRCIDECGKEGWLYAKTDVVKAEIIGNYASYVLDIDNDTLYDYLILNVTVKVNTAGLYILPVDLYIYEIATDRLEGIYEEVYINLTEGTHIISIKFDGYEIRRTGLNGSGWLFYLDLFGINGVLIDRKFIDWDNDLYHTAHYSYDEFEYRKDTFITPYSDRGIDINNNSLYDYLAINITLNISGEGYYTIGGFLTNENEEEYIYDPEFIYLDNGTHNMQLKFRGYEIYKWEIDGPYLFTDLCIYDSDGMEVDCMFVGMISQKYNTTDYSYTQFEHYPELFNNFSDSISDSYYEDNGIMYKNLIINISVNVSDAGDYIIAGELYDENKTLVTESGNIYSLIDGTQIIQLNFSGGRIYNNGVDGNYSIEKLSLKDVNAEVLDYVENAHTTSEYNYSQFRLPPDLASANISYDNMRIFALIKNLMTINDKILEEVNVSLYIDNQLNQTKILNLRNKRNETVNFSTAALGKHNVTVKVDADDKILELNETNNELNTDLIFYHPCDLNRDGIYTRDYSDLMTAYKCFLGIERNCKINYRDWAGMKTEYLCFVDNKQ